MSARQSTLRVIILYFRKLYVKRNINVLNVERENELSLERNRNLTTLANFRLGI